MTIRWLVLGGYGNLGGRIAEHLLAETSLHILIAGRHLQRAEARAAGLGTRFGADRVSARAVDAADPRALARALEGVSLVVVASSSAGHAGTVLRAALSAGSDYFDTQFSGPRKHTQLEPLLETLEHAGRCAVTDGGGQPGLPAALIRLAARRMTSVHLARVGGLTRPDWREGHVSTATLDEMMEEIRAYRPLVLEHGRWHPIARPGHFRFGRPFGLESCYPMFLEELRPLPALVPGLTTGGFWTGGFNGFTDWLVLPAAGAAMEYAPRLLRRPAGRLLGWSLRAFGHPPFGGVLQLEAQGEAGGTPVALKVRLAHPDPWSLAAAAASSALLQLLDGSARRPGLWWQGLLVDPDRTLEDLRRLGINVWEWAPALAESGPGLPQPA